jgi:hypothetical protein
MTKGSVKGIGRGVREMDWASSSSESILFEGSGRGRIR